MGDLASSQVSKHGLKRTFRVFRDEERGQSLVEMALVLPLLLLLVVGIIEIGRYAEMSLLVTNAARAGVQYGAQNLATAGDTTGIQNAAHNESPVVTTAGVTSSILCGCSGQTPGACPVTSACGSSSHAVVYLKVTTTANFSPLFNYPGIPSLTTLNGSAEMRVAQ